MSNEAEEQAKRNIGMKPLDEAYYSTFYSKELELKKEIYRLEAKNESMKEIINRQNKIIGEEDAYKIEKLKEVIRRKDEALIYELKRLSGLPFKTNFDARKIIREALTEGQQGEKS